jgi:D-glycero-beta-D-manno-heptose 1-phosphate adenylyltransferase
MKILNRITHKITTFDALHACVSGFKKSGKRVVFTNGCFDILHLGHVTYLAQAAEQGDVLIVALNSDQSVRNQGKGDNRPVNPEMARAILLASLEFVDFVILFDADTPLQLIEKLLPDVLVKGSDYDENETNPQSKKYIVGSDSVRKAGGNVATIDLVKGFSSTAIIEKMKQGN